MALFKNARAVAQWDDPAFDELHNPGASAPRPGIYRCANCGREIASDAGDPLPPADHHPHPAHVGPIRWQLIVYAEER